MIKVQIGYMVDDLIKNKVSMLVNKDHQNVVYKKLNTETIEDIPEFTQIVLSNMKPHITDETEFTLELFDKKYLIPINDKTFQLT